MTVIGGDPGYCSILLSDLHRDECHTDVTLCSDGSSVVVHSALLSRCSEIMNNILSSTVVDTIILPGFSSVLSDFVSLVYTGETTTSRQEDKKLLAGLCSLLGMHTSVSRKDMKNIDNYIEKMRKLLADSECLKLTTELESLGSGERFFLRFPRRKKASFLYLTTPG